MANADRPGIHSLDIPSERQENKGDFNVHELLTCLLPDAIN